MEKSMRMKTRDVAFKFRMNAGFPGDVNRSHPASILASKQDSTKPVPYVGMPAMLTAAGAIRYLNATDDGTTNVGIHGIVVRPYPMQAPSSSGSYGGQTLGSGQAAAPADGVVDVVREGHILASVVGTGIVRGAAVYVWTAASTGSHVQGGFESAASAGNTLKVLNAIFNGPEDANGVAEIFISAQV